MRLMLSLAIGRFTVRRIRKHLPKHVTLFVRQMHDRRWHDKN
jgi:hypothetical protein